jgi:hypothetical protein
MDGGEARISPEQDAQGDLGVLLEAEERLGRLLEEAAARAEAVVEGARRDAEAAAERSALELGQAGTELRAALLAEREQAVSEVGRRLRAESERFREVDAAGVDRLAGVVVEGLLRSLVSGAGR